MQFTLTIDCDGAAFEDYPAEEVAAILTRLLDKAPGFSHRNLGTADPGDRTEEDPFVLLDRNGARVGIAYFAGLTTTTPKGYRNYETERFRETTDNAEPIYDQILAFTQDCLRRVPNMTTKTLGYNIKALFRSWVDLAREGEPIRNLGWGPTGDLPIPRDLLLRVAAHIGDLTALDEECIGETWLETARNHNGARVGTGHFEGV